MRSFFRSTVMLALCALAFVASALAASQTAVLYEEDLSDKNGKRYVGSVIWATETDPSNPGQSSELMIRAYIEVPARKLALTWSLRRNMDKGLPSSHLVEVK